MCLAVVDRRERRQRVHAEGSFLDGRFAEHRHRLGLTEIRQRDRRVESHLQGRMLQPGFENRDRVIADRFQLQRGQLGLVGIEQLRFQLLHANMPRDRRLAERDVADHLAIARVVVLVAGQHFQLDGLIGESLRKRLAQSTFVVGEESLANFVGDSLGLSHAAKVAAKLDAQVAILLGDSAAENFSAALQTGVVRLTFAGRDQQRALRLRQNVTFHHPLTGNDGGLGQFRFEQPAAVEALRRVPFGNANLDVEGFPFANHRRQISTHDDQCRVRRTQDRFGIVDASATHVVRQNFTIRRRGRITACPVQTDHQADSFQRHEIQIREPGVVADHRSFDFGLKLFCLVFVLTFVFEVGELFRLFVWLVRRLRSQQLGRQQLEVLAADDRAGQQQAQRQTNTDSERLHDVAPERARQVTRFILNHWRA